MIQNKLSPSTRIALQNNFADLRKDNSGRVSAFVKVNKNVDEQLKAIGIWINPKSNPNVPLFTIAFPPSSFGQLTDIDGVEYIDVGSAVSQKEIPANLSKPFFDKPTTNNTDKQANTQKVLTTKNIVLSVLAIGVILGLLKWQKL